jgi:plastocyanin
MKSCYQCAGTLIVLLLLGVALLYSGPAVGAAGGGKITGSIKLDGTPAHQRPIDMSKDPVCAQQHTGNPVKTETVVVGPNGGLQYVVVYISEGLPEGAASAVPSQPVTFEQKGCVYQPHVIAINVGQKLQVTTADPTTHNIHPLPAAGTGNIGWNKSQPPGAPPIESTWKAPEVAIPVKCNIHPWMHGYMAVVKGPYAVSDDKGSFTIDNVPPGSYTLTAWQETYGTQTQKVTVASGKSATADFTFKAK